VVAEALGGGAHPPERRGVPSPVARVGSREEQTGFSRRRPGRGPGAGKGLAGVFTPLRAEDSRARRRARASLEPRTALTRSGAGAGRWPERGEAAWRGAAGAQGLPGRWWSEGQRRRRTGSPAALAGEKVGLENVRWRNSAQGMGRRGHRLGGSGAAGPGAASGSAGGGGAGTRRGRTRALGAKTPKERTRLALEGGTSAATRRRSAPGGRTRCACPVGEGRFIR
jgi:hypothetical protein